MPRLLIVEDQHSLREILKAVFEDDHEVKTAVNGFEALDIITVWQPDVMITDYAMPGITGMQVIQKIENRESKNIKIILYSACLTAEIKREAKALGVVACVDKPFDVEELREIIKELTASPYGDKKTQRTQS